MPLPKNALPTFPSSVLNGVELSRLLATFRQNLHLIEADFQAAMEADCGLESSHHGRATRWEKAYQLQRALKALSRAAPGSSAEVEPLLQRALELARENPLYKINPHVTDAVIVRRQHLRSGNPSGEPFLFCCLERATAFYTEPYQLTYSQVPPNHEQEIHGHLLTDELTMALDDHMTCKIFRWRNGRVVERKEFDVPRFHAAQFAARTPHTILNRSLNWCVRNATVKFRHQVIDRWNIAEGPHESHYTFCGEVSQPTETRADGYSTYGFDKGPLVQEAIAVDAGAEYTPQIGTSDERGVFVAKGEVDVDTWQTQKAREGDIIFLCDKRNCQSRIVNRTPREVVLVEVFLKEPVLHRFRRAQSRRYRALVTYVKGVLTDPDTGQIAGEALGALVDLLSRSIPILVLASGPERRELCRLLEERVSPIEAESCGCDRLLFLGEVPGRVGGGVPGHAAHASSLERHSIVAFAEIERFKERFSLADSELLVFGSRAAKGELHQALLDHLGGFTTDTYSSRSLRIVPLRHLSGRLGHKSFLWALNRLHIGPPAKDKPHELPSIQ